MTNVRIRCATLAVALCLSAPAAAHYVAVPAASAASAKLPLQGVVWTCGGEVCTAQATNSRPETVCAAFTRKLGAVRSFAAGDRVFDAAALEKCNARAKS